MDALRQIDGWDVPFAAAGVTGVDATVATRGDTRRAVRLASVSKPVSALATLVAAEEGVVDLDEPAGPPGSTVRHLLAHASGLPFHGARADRAARAAAASTPTRASASSASTSPPARRCRSPTTSARPCASRSGSASTRRGIRAPACTPASRTCSRSAASCSQPTLVAPETHAEMVAVQFPGLDGVLPDFGRFSPMDWGLGVELKTTKQGHWTGSLTSPATFGHFGGSGTFLWVDPTIGRRVRLPDDAGVRRVGEGGVAGARRTRSCASSVLSGTRLQLSGPTSDSRLTVDGVSSA